MTLGPEELKKVVMDYVGESAPEFAGEEPVVTEEVQGVPPDLGKKLGLKSTAKDAPKVTVFTFQKMVTAEDGAQLPIVNRVTVDENGNIIKSTGN